MKKIVSLPLIVCVFIFILISYKYFLRDLVPLPFDLLISEYSPWKYSSFLGYNPGSFPNKAQYFDVIRQFYPWKEFIFSQISSLAMPLWNPHNFSGSPLLANFQSAVFYPFNVLFLFLSRVDAWSILLFLQIPMAFFFTYLYARVISLSSKASVLSSVAFSLSLYMSTFFEYAVVGHTIIWLPLLLFSIEKYIQKNSSFAILVFGISAVVSLFAGHLQLFLYVYAFSLIYFFARTFYIQKSNWRSGLKAFPLFALPLGIGAIQLLPTFELLSISARAPHTQDFIAKDLLIQGREFILFFVPDFFGNPVTRNYTLSDSYPGNSVYIGMIPIIFSILGILYRRGEKRVVFFGIMVVVLLLLLINNPMSQLIYSLDLPIISASAPTNAIFLLSFSLAILSGFGIDHWIKEKNILRIIAPLFIVSSIFVAYGMFIIAGDAGNFKNFLLSGVLLGLSAFVILFGSFFSIIKRGIILYILILIVIVDLFYFFNKFNPYSPREFAFPGTAVMSFLQENAGINRFWGYGFASIDANFATHYKIFSPDGYDPLYPQYYGQFIHASKDGRLLREFDRTTRSDAVIAPGYGETDMMDNEYRLRMLDALGVKFVLDRVENGSTERTFPGERFEKVYDKEGWMIYENKEVEPRIYLTSDIDYYSTKEEFETKFFSTSSAVLLAQKIGDSIAGGKSSVTSVDYEPNNIKIGYISDTTQLLYMSDTYYPGWKAYVDGEEREILRANYAFRGVVVPEGRHSVEFIYNPASYLLGRMITLGSIAILFAWFFIMHLKKYESE